MNFLLLATLVLLGRPDVTKSVVTIHQDAFERRLHFEEALLVRKDSVDFVAGSEDAVWFRWDDSILMVVHTHPDKGFEKPSSQDVKMAVQHHVPVYVVSESQIWYATAQGEIEQVTK
jgi:proteasome lid subunit RPN8/RPN11